MILELAAAVAVGGFGYGVYKHYTAGSTVKTAVAAEVAAVEAEASAVGSKLSADAKAAYTAVATRVKVVLAKL
jgi:hypothetical protein